MYSGLFFLRLAVGIIFIYHALPKLSNTKEKASYMGWTQGQTFGLGVLEFVSSVALISGVATKLGAFVLVLVMLGALYHKMKKWHVPFSSHDKTGWEFDLVLLASSLTIYLK